MAAIIISLRVTAPAPSDARVSVGRRQFSIGRPVEFDDASPHVAALEYALGAVGGEVVNGLREFARRRRLPIDAVEAQRRSGNGCRAIAMRDTDRDRISYIVARRRGPVQVLGDLKGRAIATGAIDSPQATLIPLGRLRREGLNPGVDVTVRRFDVLVCKHGDHVGGELDALFAMRYDNPAHREMMDLEGLKA